MRQGGLNFDHRTAKELYRWGELEITGRERFSLQVRNELGQVVRLEYDGTNRTGLIRVSAPGEDQVTLQETPLPASRVEVSDLYESDPSGKPINALVVIADFGLLGDLRYGITQKGKIISRNNLNLKRNP